MLFIEVILMNKIRLRRNIYALLFIIIAGISVLLSQWYLEVNKYHDIEDSNSFRWQQYMNEEEYDKVENGMSYQEVVQVVKGQGELVEEGVYLWEDELLMTQNYEIIFEKGKVVKKKIIEKSGYSTR